MPQMSNGRLNPTQKKFLMLTESERMFCSHFETPSGDLQHLLVIVAQIKWLQISETRCNSWIDLRVSQRKKEPATAMLPSSVKVDA